MNDTIEFQTHWLTGNRSIRVSATILDSTLNAFSREMLKVVMNGIVEKLAAAYIEQHGADILDQISPETVATEIRNRMRAALADKLLKGDR